MKLARLFTVALLLLASMLLADPITQVTIDNVTYDVVPNADLLVLRVPSRATTQPATLPTTRLVAAATKPVRPDATNVGIASTLSLTPAVTFAIKPGATYDGLAFTGTKTFRLAKGDTVTFRHCRFDADGNAFAVRCDDNLGTIVIDHCELLNATAAAVYGDGFEVTNSVIRHIGGDGFKPGSNALIAGNYITELGWNAPTAHADGVQISGGSDIRIVGNYFDMPRNVAGTKSNACFFLQGASSNVTFEGNFCRGGNYAVHAWADGAGGPTIRIAGNTFYAGSSQYGFGNLAPDVVWSANVNELGKLVSKSDK